MASRWVCYDPAQGFLPVKEPSQYRSQHRNQKKSLVIVSEKAKDLVDPKRVD